MRPYHTRLVEPLESRRLLSAVTGLTLINADTDQSIGTLSNGYVVNLATARHLNIQAKLDSSVGSVRFAYDSNSSYQTESSAPYAIGGDTGGNFDSWTPTVGTHTIKATPYSGTKATGTAGTAKSVTITVVDSATSTSTTPPASTPTTPPPSSSGTFAHVYTAGPGGTYKTIAAAAAVAGPGDQVLIMPGTYTESLALTRSGTSTAPITFSAKTPGSVIFDGSGKKNVIKSNGAKYITFEGITVNKASNSAASDPAAVETSTGWTLRNMTVQNTDGVGVKVYGSNVLLYNVTANYNGRQGISGSNCSYVTVQNCTTRGNNTRNNNPDYDGGAGKWFDTDHVTIDNMTSYENIGPGIWFDYSNTNAVIKNSRSYNNRGLANAWSGNGLRLELNISPITVQNNVFYGNTGPQIDIQSSKYVTVTGNTITGTSVALKDWPRGSENALSDISITNNTFIKSGIMTEGGTWTTTSGSAKRLTIDRNTYQQGLTFNWNYKTYYSSLSDVRSKLNFEWNGKTA